jgi:WD40 repeat protein
MSEESPTPAPVPPQLSSHHRDTLEQIFRHPGGNNIEWHDVLSLLEAVGSVTESPDGKYLVSLGGETETIKRPKHKDIEVQQVVDLRRMLRAAGYEPHG